MEKLTIHEKFVKANIRLEELIDVVTDSTPLDDPLAKEFMEITHIIEKYEKTYYLI